MTSTEAETVREVQSVECTSLHYYSAEELEVVSLVSKVVAGRVSRKGHIPKLGLLYSSSHYLSYPYSILTQHRPQV